MAGLTWNYDCIHENQVDWYAQELGRITAQNGGVQPKSLAFFHMPLQEMQTAYYEYRDNGFRIMRKPNNCVQAPPTAFCVVGGAFLLFEILYVVE